MASTSEPTFTGGRLVVGSTILVSLIVYNEACATAVLFANFLALVYGAMAAYCKTKLRALQIPYVRASNKFDFTCLFLATWMDALAVLCACAMLARTMSTCLDAMTGGMARIFILGRNSSENEPWPDVLGVAVVLLVTGMFMFGLENSRVFTMVMLVALMVISIFTGVLTAWTVDLQEWTRYYFRPNGISSFLTAAALLTFTYPGDYPAHRSGIQCLAAFSHILLAFISLMLTALSYTSLVHYRAVSEYIAIPVFTMLNEHDFHQLIPVAACLLMLCSSTAYLDLFPELYGFIVRFATSEWKLFSRHISYESSESGNPVLAIFIGGSLCAMFAFACPMQNLSYILAASHLCAGLFRSFYLLYSPYRPRFAQPSNSNSTLSYSRLSTAPTACVSSSSSYSRTKRSLLNISLHKQAGRMNQKPKKELEKEWLLLGEPTSPCPARESRDVESTILSDSEPAPSDFEYPDKFEKSDSDTSTDIDDIVDEYRQKIKVTTAGPTERVLRVPSSRSWHFASFGIILIISSVFLTHLGVALKQPFAIFTYCCGVTLISSMMSLLPSHSGTVINVNPVLCSSSLLLGGVLFGASSYYSWPAILVWFIAGIIMVLRCDNWCCGCFKQSGGSIQEQPIPSVADNTNATTTTIRIPRPPNNVVTIPTRVNLNR
ncbi:solute carrier family 7 member 14 isoform X2 [Eurosta solidaginis]|uniref:solute carrier family 7 member 14 isoform X2 n=1 Tax=Eurosta solidaginis TaxID=178769 RepID=UPI00353145BA